MKRKSKNFAGTNITKISSQISVGCISPEARDLLDRVTEAWNKHKMTLPDKATLGDETWNPRESIHGFAYWLIRWSGLVEPSATKV